MQLLPSENSDAAKASPKVSANSVRKPREQAFTLVELLVALALASIISLAISQISTTAQHMYVEMTKKVEVYQKFRFAFKDIQESIPLMQPTPDLEFFLDQAGADVHRGHWGDGEEYKGDENIGGGLAGKYDEAASVTQRSYFYTNPTSLSDEPVEYAADSLYFRGLAEVDGELRTCNIEYFLAEPQNAGSVKRIYLTGTLKDNKNLVLVKQVRYLDAKNIDSPDAYKVRTRVKTLCNNVRDFRVEYMFDRLGDGKESRYITPKEEQALRRRVSQVSSAPGNGVRAEFLYGGWKNRSQGVFRSASRMDGRFTEAHFRDNNVPFSELTTGDKIFMWSARNASFAPQTLTVDRNQAGKIYFQEKVDSSNWTDDKKNPPLRYRAAFLPRAFRITISLFNDKGKEPRQMSLEIGTRNKK